MKVLLSLLVVVSGALGRASVAPRFGISDGRIIGGHDAERNENPYQGSLQYGSGGKYQHACGCVIISPSAVLTAAHCIVEAPALGSYIVTVGVLNINEDNPERQDHRVSYALVNPNYEGGIGPHDIAVVKVAEPFVFSDAVQPINLPAIDYHTSGEAKMVGWGSIGGSETPIMPVTQQVATVDIINITECRRLLDLVLNNATHPLDDYSNICSSSDERKSICTGDSGGPLVYKRFDDTMELVGLASWGITPCGTPRAPSVFVKIHQYAPWIRQHMW